MRNVVANPVREDDAKGLKWLLAQFGAKLFGAHAKTSIPVCSSRLL